MKNELKELYTNLAQQMTSMIPTKWNNLLKDNNGVKLPQKQMMRLKLEVKRRKLFQKLMMK
ncbi:hypothetical protein RyT2_20670 [Pseudolactococcus yaeyamensis]